MKNKTIWIIVILALLIASFTYAYQKYTERYQTPNGSPAERPVK